MLKRLCTITATTLGVGALANGLFMLASPEGWYFAVPGVTTTGPFNQHFLRDIGIIFLFIGIAYLIGVARPPYRLVLWAAATLWLCSHALFHIWEVAVGICGASALVRDFAAVTLPALLGTGVTLWAIGRRRDGSAAAGTVTRLRAPGKGLIVTSALSPQPWRPANAMSGPGAAKWSRKTVCRRCSAVRSAMTL